LVELLAASSAIVVLGLVAAPAVQQARVRARGTTCADTLHNLSLGMLAYTVDHEDYFPGVNTSGVAVRAKRMLWGSDPSVLHDSSLPVQSFDWMRPVAGYIGVDTLPDNRAERWHELWTRFRCPQQRATSQVYGVGSPDGDDFEAFTWPACSYLMPAYFSYWGQAHAGDVLSQMEGFPQLPVRARALPSSWEVANEDFVSRLTEVGPPASKVFLADGTRYVGDGYVSIDVDPDPSIFGALSGSGGWWSGSSAYGVRTGSLTWDDEVVPYGSPAEGGNLLLSYRHWPEAGPPMAAPRPDGSAQTNSGAINAVFFDGHVASLTDQASREISLWYPTGSVVNDDIGMTHADPGTVIP
jgi:prepilin-type processing-associated H-X9-DG protein